MGKGVVRIRVHAITEQKVGVDSHPIDTVYKDRPIT